MNPYNSGGFIFVASISSHYFSVFRFQKDSTEWVIYLLYFSLQLRFISWSITICVATRCSPRDSPHVLRQRHMPKDLLPITFTSCSPLFKSRLCIDTRNTTCYVTLFYTTCYIVATVVPSPILSVRKDRFIYAYLKTELIYKCKICPIKLFPKKFFSLIYKILGCHNKYKKHKHKRNLYLSYIIY